MNVNKCVELLKAASLDEAPGRTLNETATSLCLAAQVHKAAAGGLTPEALLDMQTSRWPSLNKAIDGGFQHLISVDNGAVYAELWSKGDSWYAVTDAGINLAAGIRKGMDARDATPLFLKAVFGAPKKGCCGG
jgi:hypothetical protein